MKNKEHKPWSDVTDDEIKSEVWKDVCGYGGLYMVSDLGRIKSFVYYNGANVRFLKPQISKRGYYFVDLCKNNVKKKLLLHRLVAEAFIPNPENKPCIDHIDRNGINNRVSNLRWCTQKENCNNKFTKEYRDKTRYYEDGLKRATERSISISMKPIIQIDKFGNIVNEFKSMAEAKRLFGYSSSCICRCCKGQRELYKGFKWMYK